VALLRTDVSEERISSIFSVRSEAHPRSRLEDSESCNPEDRGDMLFRNVGSYYSHTVSHPTRQHPSFPLLLPMSLAAGTFTEPLPSNDRRCNTQVHGLVRGIYDVRRSDGIRRHDMISEFHQNCFRHSKIDDGIFTDSKVIA
jgi:hypothetical protein